MVTLITAAPARPGAQLTSCAMRAATGEPGPTFGAPVAGPDPAVADGAFHVGHDDVVENRALARVVVMEALEQVPVAVGPHGLRGSGLLPPDPRVVGVAAVRVAVEVDEAVDARVLLEPGLVLRAGHLVVHGPATGVLDPDRDIARVAVERVGLDSDREEAGAEVLVDEVLHAVAADVAVHAPVDAARVALPRHRVAGGAARQVVAGDVDRPVRPAQLEVERVERRPGETEARGPARTGRADPLGREPLLAPAHLVARQTLGTPALGGEFVEQLGLQLAGGQVAPEHIRPTQLGHVDGRTGRGRLAQAGIEHRIVEHDIRLGDERAGVAASVPDGYASATPASANTVARTAPLVEGLIASPFSPWIRIVRTLTSTDASGAASIPAYGDPARAV